MLALCFLGEILLNGNKITEFLNFETEWREDERFIENLVFAFSLVGASCSYCHPSPVTTARINFKPFISDNLFGVRWGSWHRSHTSNIGKAKAIYSPAFI